MSDIPGFDRAQARFDAQEDCEYCGGPSNGRFCSLECKVQWEMERDKTENEDNLDEDERR